MSADRDRLVGIIGAAFRKHGLIGGEVESAVLDAANTILARNTVLPGGDPVRSPRDMLRVALLNPDHIEPYHYNANFHYSIDMLIQLLPLWIKAMADAARDQDAKLADMTRLARARWSDPVTIEANNLRFADLQNLLRPTEPTKDQTPE